MKNQLTTTANFFKQISETIYLFKEQWKEKTIALLRSPREADKTPIITEIINDITSSGRQLIYVNTEHRAETFVEHFVTNEKVLIYTPAYESPEDRTDYADLVIAGIEEAIAETGIRTFIVDSVTRIAALSFGRNASPVYIMKRLAALQARHNISLLVIAHSSTKSTDRALTALADSEISDIASSETPVSSIQVAQTVPTDNSAQSIQIDQPAKSIKSDKSPYAGYYAPVYFPQYPRPMNRRERRAIERQNRKHTLRNNRLKK